MLFVRRQGGTIVRAAAGELIKIFYNTCNSLPATHAGRDYAEFFVQSFHILDKLYGELAAGAAQRMAEGNGSAVDIHDSGVQLQPPDNGEGLGGESLI